MTAVALRSTAKSTSNPSSGAISTFLMLPDRGLEQIEPLLEGEEWLLLIVVRDGHDHFVEQFAGAIDDIQVPIRHRIEAAGINRASDHGKRRRRMRTSQRQFASSCGA